MGPRTAAVTAPLSALALLLGACGAAKPAALPDDADFRSCLSQAGVSTKALDTFDARRTAFEKPAPWDCVLGLSSAGDRHAVLEGVFPSDGAALLKVMTAWIDSQKGDGEAIARDVGTLMAAADDPMPQDRDKASLRTQDDKIFDDRLALDVYLHADGKPPGYDSYLNRTDMKGHPDAQNRYFQHQLDLGGSAADRLAGYTTSIDAARNHLRAK